MKELKHKTTPDQHFTPTFYTSAPISLKRKRLGEIKHKTFKIKHTTENEENKHFNEPFKTEILSETIKILVQHEAES